MQFHERHSERGASPVIGIILMVAVTVILAAIIGAFVLDTGGAQQTTPQAKFNFDYDGSTVTVAHNGGAKFDSDNSLSLDVTTSDGGTVADDFDVASVVNSGDTATVNGVSSGETVSVVWTGPNGDQSQVLASWEMP